MEIHEIYLYSRISLAKIEKYDGRGTVAMKETMEILWRDRKRILGMPITFTRYSMSKDRLFLETGLLNTAMEEVILYRVRDISLRISLGQKLFGVGSILVQSSDKSIPKLELKNIKNPREVKELIHRQVEEMKLERRMRVGEILDNDSDDCDHDDAMLL